jgi:CAAX protease family protein
MRPGSVLRGVRLEHMQFTGSRHWLLARWGLSRWTPFHRDPWFLAAIAAGFAFWLALFPWLRTPLRAPLGAAMLVSVLLWQPLIEELVFRGVMQGQLRASAWGQSRLLGLTHANWLASGIFTALHFLQHPPLWACGVLVPSLIFGFFRDRHGSVYPSMALHIYYNAGYFLTAGFA